MTRIAIFGGAFDPPHHGHIHAAVLLQERHHIDKVYVIPSYRTTWKKFFYSPEKRVQMTQLAFATIPAFQVVPIEIASRRDSYTIDTVQMLMEQDSLFASAQRYLFLGADTISTLSLWKDYEELFSLVKPLIAVRSSDQLRIPQEVSPRVAKLIVEGWTDTGLLDISSTLIKERFFQNRYIDHLLPKAVLECMREEFYNS